jgi:hypothetical protein
MADDDIADEIPSAILKKHPELVSVTEALRQLRNHEPVTATCIKCHQLLQVSEVEATGALVIRCPDGHTLFRARRDKR